MAETSRYYLIAWRPESDAGRDERPRKIQISVVGRPELTVRLARGLAGSGATPLATAVRVGAEEKGATKQEKNPEADLRQALADAHARHALPLQLSLIYLDTPASGTVLTTSVQPPAEFLSYGAQDREPTQLTVARASSSTIRASPPRASGTLSKSTRLRAATAPSTPRKSSTTTPRR